MTRVVLRDARGDVRGLTGFAESDSYEPAPDRPTADVLRATATHGRGAVTVRMQFADLRREDAQVYVAVVHTSRRVIFATVGAEPGAWRGRHQLVDYERGHIRCSGLTHSIDYAANRVMLRVPRSCIGRPTWVRVTMMNYALPSGGDEFVELTDNPHNQRSSGGSTPRLYRG